MQILAAALLGLFLVNAASAHTHPPGLTHLKFAGDTVHAHILWTSGPSATDASTLTIDWKNGADHTPVAAPGKFTFAFSMPDMGHRAAPPTITQVKDASGALIVGSYQVSDIWLGMGGAWKVDVSVTYPDNHVETQSYTFNLDADGGHKH